jgi:hypothetical protein
MKNLLLILFIVLSINGFAYKPYNHAVITEYAIKLLNEKYPDFHISIEQSYYLIKGDEKEDNFCTFNLQRARNWHFYNTERLDKKSILVYRNAWKRYNYLKKKLYKSKVDKNTLIRIGSILHHIQDATNPSHAAPVYHGLYDSFDILNFADYSIDSISGYSNNFQFKRFVDTILYSTVCITKENLKSKFMVNMKSRDSVFQKEIGWDAFWILPEKGKEFGQRGILGTANKNCKKEFDNFMSDSIYYNNCTYYVPKTIYDFLAKKQFEIAVNRTAQFIYFAFMEKGLINKN